MTPIPDVDVTAADILDGIRGDEFFYCYQPKTSFESGKLVGAEALMRWRRNGRLIPPGIFIPIAEATGLMPTLFEHMLPHFTADILSIRGTGVHIPISINVSTEDLKVSRPVDLLHELVTSKLIEGQDVQVEVTESIVLVDNPQIKKSVGRLVDSGIKLLMDDFGTGYSSIDVLSRFPFSYVKMDMGLISRMTGSLKNYRIVKGILHLTRDLNIKTVAEGVETNGAYQTLQMMGCTEAQGYFISPPLAVADFNAFLAETAPLPGTQIGTLFSLQAGLTSHRKSIVGTIMCHHGDSSTEPEPSAMEQEIEHDPKNCRFGKWYYGEGRAFQDHAAYHALEAPHRQMREAGLKIIEAAYSDDPDFGEVISMIRDLNDHGSKVDRLMSELIEGYLIDRNDRNISAAA